MKVYSEEEQLNQKSQTSVKVTSYARIYLWFGLGILLTGLVGFGLPFILSGMNIDNAIQIYTILTIVSAIVTLPLMIVIQLRALKSSPIASTICYIIYSLAFGVLLSSLLMFAGLGYAVLAFAITGGIMLVMGIFGALLGNRLKNVYMVTITLMLSSLVLALVNVFFFNETLYWIVTFAMLAVIMLYVVIDMARIKFIVSNSPDGLTNSLAIYCAYLLYSDFIYIFVRVLIILASSRRN